MPQDHNTWQLLLKPLTESWVKPRYDSSTINLKKKLHGKSQEQYKCHTCTALALVFSPAGPVDSNALNICEKSQERYRSSLCSLGVDCLDAAGLGTRHTFHMVREQG